jgi:serine/threonine-protein kinase
VVPDVWGLRLSNASSRLKAAGLRNIQSLYGCYGSSRIGTVVRQAPRPGARQQATSPVHLYLQASDCATVPNVTGQSLGDATKALRRAGFTDITHSYQCLGSRVTRRVLRQSPTAGTSYERSKPVALLLQDDDC